METSVREYDASAKPRAKGGSDILGRVDIEAKRDALRACILCTGPSDRKEFEAVAVQRDSLVALVPKTHPLAGQPRIDLRDLAEEAFVLGDRVAWAVYNRHLMRACENAGFQPKIVQTAPEVRAIVGLVSCGLGVTVMPASHATALDARTVALQISDRTYPLITEAVWIEKSSHPAMARFVAHVRQYELKP